MAAARRLSAAGAGVERRLSNASAGERRLSTAGAGAERRVSNAAVEPEAFMDKLMFDEDAQEGFLKDLISAARLRSAWETLLRRMQIVERSVTNLREVCDREALERDFVLWPTFDRRVEKEHTSELRILSLGLDDTKINLDRNENLTQDALQHIEDLQANMLKANMRIDGLVERIQTVEDRDRAQHQELLDLLSKSNQEHLERHQATSDRIQELEECVRQTDDRALILTDRVREQEEYVAGKRLDNRISHVCNDLLVDYVNKEEMLREVQVCADHVVRPVRQGLEDLSGNLDKRVAELRETDRTLHGTLTENIQNVALMERSCESQFQELFRELGNRATVIDLERVEQTSNLYFAKNEDSLEKLREEASRKMQELVDRVSEFQILLEDHEHALQHQAEELMNRATKYDLVVCQQRVDKCALKERVDSELKELQATVAWQTDQLETLGCGKSFSVGFARSDSVSSMRSGAGRKSQALSGAAAAASAGTPAPGSTPVPTSPVAAAAASGTAAAPGSGCVGAGPGQDEQPSVALTDSTAFPDAKDSLFQSQAPNASEMTSMHVRSYSGVDEEPRSHFSQERSMLPQVAHTEVYSLMRMQLEAMAQAICGLGFLTSRTQGPNLSREARQDKESELLHHLQCLLQWIMHGRAPLSWEPDRLATFSLTSLSRILGPDSDPLRDRSPDARVPGHAAARQRRVAGEATEKRWTAESRAIARDVSAASRAAMLPPPHLPAPLGGGFTGSRVRGFTSRGPGSRPSTVPVLQTGGLGAMAPGCGSSACSLFPEPVVEPLSAGHASRSRVAPLPRPAGGAQSQDAGLLASAMAIVNRGDTRTVAKKKSLDSHSQKKMSPTPERSSPRQSLCQPLPQVTRSGDCMSVCTDELEEAVADVQAAIAR